MNIKEFYELIGGDYEEVTARLRTDERIAKFLGMFLHDESFDAMCQALDANDIDEAFKGSHNLKGVSANLGLENIRKAASDICEQCRHGAPDESLPELYEIAKMQYAVATENICKILQTTNE